MAARPTSQALHKNAPAISTSIRLCKLSPKYLSSNATSHTWVFSAIAELIDNAYDPDVKATQLHINHRQISGHDCLVFTDDGNGLNEEQLYSMLSFGYSDKSSFTEYAAIGVYGNGFKSGSMRLGKDAIVLTKRGDRLAVGLLSRTYHEKINADTIHIPIAIFDKNSLTLAQPLEENRENLAAILDHSVFPNLDDLIAELTSVVEFDLRAESGTKIIIWNLSEISDGSPELQIRPDLKDIVFNDPDFYEGAAAYNEPQNGNHISGHTRSLRHYCSTLYLRPRMKIYILGEKVKSRLIAKDLCKTATDMYTMKGQQTLSITFGFNPSNRKVTEADYGVMMYHKNRLIKAYEKVGYQKLPNGELGVGVVGVVEADFLTPTHNKQCFAVDEKYMRLMSALGKKLNEYYDIKCAHNSARHDTTPKINTDALQPDTTWVQCDSCLKWRRLPDGVEIDNNATWYCAMHPNGMISEVGCRYPEDTLNEGEVDVTSPSAMDYRREKKAKEAASKISIIRKRMQSAVCKTSPCGGRDGETQLNGANSGASPQKKPRWTETLTRAVESLSKRAEEYANSVSEQNATSGSRSHKQDDGYRTVCCIQCEQWRKLPVGLKLVDVDTWECKMHPDPKQRVCRTLDEHPYSLSSSPSLSEEEIAIFPSAACQVELGQPRQEIIPLDSAENALSDNNGDGMPKEIREQLKSLETTLGTIITRGVKPEKNHVGTQTVSEKEMESVGVQTREIETTSVLSQTDKEENVELKERLAVFLQYLLRDNSITPEQAPEAIRQLTEKYEKQNAKKEDSK